MQAILRKSQFVVLYMSILLGTLLHAQECEIVKDNGDGSYVVRIEGQELLAITEQMQKNALKMKNDLDQANQILAQNDALIKKYEVAVEQYKKTLDDQKEYVGGLEEIVKEYKALVKDYKKLKQPWLTFDVGAGATKKTKPAVIFGLGIRSIRVGAFLQENNGGVIASYSIPIF
jgi:hypothetical protein